jgi:hypothetical protein
MASARTSTPRGDGEGNQARGSLLALFLYFGVMLLLLLVFTAVGFYACSASVPQRVGFFPPL